MSQPGYYVFYTTDLTFHSAWTALLGPFNYGDLTGLPGYPFSGNVNTITQLEWALRPPPDNSIVAVVTPEHINPAAGTAMQYGCVAVNFDMNANVDNWR